MRIPRNRRPNIGSATLKWLSVFVVAVGGTLAGGAFEIWQWPRSGYLLAIAAGIVAIGLLVDTGFGATIREFLGWRRLYKIALQEQSRMEFQLGERVRKRLADDATVELLMQLLLTEDERDRDKFCDLVAQVLIVFSDAPKYEIDQLVFRLKGEFLKDCSLAATARILRLLKEQASGANAAKLLSDVAMDCEFRLRGIRQSGSPFLLYISNSDIAAFELLLTDYKDIPYKVELKRHFDAIREERLARQAVTKI